MNQNIKIVIAAVVTVGLLIAGIWWLSTRDSVEEPHPTPSPSATVDVIAPTGTPTPGATTSPGETTAPTPGETEPGHEDHDHGEATDCFGPVTSAECDEELSSLTESDTAQALAQSDHVTAFLSEWFRFDSSESDSDRLARLMKAGATEELAGTYSIVARKDTTLSSLTAKAELRQADVPIAVDKDDDGYRLYLGVNAFGEYRLGDGTGTQYTFGGNVSVWVTGDGVITKVVESFPGSEELR